MSDPHDIAADLRAAALAARRMGEANWAYQRTWDGRSRRLEALADSFDRGEWHREEP
jgi:HAMP domain-containing protein